MELLPICQQGSGLWFPCHLPSRPIFPQPSPAPSETNRAQGPSRVLGGAKHPLTRRLSVPPCTGQAVPLSRICPMLVWRPAFCSPFRLSPSPPRRAGLPRPESLTLPCSFHVLFLLPRSYRMRVPKARKPLVTGSESQEWPLTCSDVSGHLCDKHMAPSLSLSPMTLLLPCSPVTETLFANPPFVILCFKIHMPFFTVKSISDTEGASWARSWLRPPERVAKPVLGI